MPVISRFFAACICPLNKAVIHIFSLPIVNSPNRYILGGPCFNDFFKFYFFSSYNFMDVPLNKHPFPATCYPFAFYSIDKEVSNFSLSIYFSRLAIPAATSGREKSSLSTAKS